MLDPNWHLYFRSNFQSPFILFSPFNRLFCSIGKLKEFHVVVVFKFKIFSRFIFAFSRFIFASTTAHHSYSWNCGETVNFISKKRFDCSHNAIWMIFVRNVFNSSLLLRLHFCIRKIVALPGFTVLKMTALLSRSFLSLWGNIIEKHYLKRYFL